MGEGTKEVRFATVADLDRVVSILEKLTDAVVGIRAELDRVHEIRALESCDLNLSMPAGCPALD